jgi:MYXO-CTERM domain-containing protein
MVTARKAFASGLFVTVAFVFHDARADLMPGQTPCEAPPHLECVYGSRGREAVAEDTCTQKELDRLGLRFYCGMSNNDRLTEYWCRSPRLPRPPKPLRVGATDSETEAFSEKMAIWEAQRLRAFGNIERELTFGSSTEHRLRNMHTVLPLLDTRPDPMRFDCFALAAKFRRCGLEMDRCAPYWNKFRELSGSEFSEDAKDRDTFARAAIESVDGARLDAGSGTDAASGEVNTLDATPSPKAPSTAPRSCHCDMTSPSGSSSVPLALGSVLAIVLLRRRASRSRPPGST